MTFRNVFLPLVLGASLAATGCLGSGSGDTPTPNPTPDTTTQADQASTDNGGDVAVGPDTPAQPDGETKPDTPSQPDAPSPPDVPVNTCFSNGTECYAAGECCSGICTYDGNSYVAGQCVAPLPDGSYCETNAWCQTGTCQDNVCGETACTVDGASCFGAKDCCSGSCQDGVCATPTCGVLASECYGNADCCTGLCTYDVATGAYVPGVCVGPQPDGYACESADWCTSGVCTDGVCGGGLTCMAMGAECFGTGCCEGSFCSYAWDYQPGACSPLQPDGAYCYESSWCTSGNCADNQCVSATCKAVAAECFSADECCTGLCTYGGGETAGACVELCQLGDECLSDTFCASGNCDAGTCGEPKVTFADIWDLVIVPNSCNGGYCHGTGGNGSGLSFMDQEMGYWTLTQNLAGYDACNAYAYVVPYEPEQSVLWLRTRPAAQDAGDPCFEKMPKGSDGLDDDSAELVKQWILAGAPQ